MEASSTMSSFGSGSRGRQRKWTLWWLEMNSNPILPPEGYPLILGSLFGPVSAPVRTAVPDQAAAQEQAAVA